MVRFCLDLSVLGAKTEKDSDGPYNVMPHVGGGGIQAMETKVLPQGGAMAMTHCPTCPHVCPRWGREVCGTCIIKSTP